MNICKVDGVNSAGVVGYKPYDHHCPEMGGDIARMNCYESSCKLRQKTKDRSSPCFEGCTYIKKLENRQEDEAIFAAQSIRQRAVGIRSPEFYQQLDKLLSQRGLFFREIGEIMKISRTTVRNQMLRLEADRSLMEG